jgi:hypothetical protein
MNLPFLMFMITEDGKQELIKALRENPGADPYKLADELGIDTSLWMPWDWDAVISEV